MDTICALATPPGMGGVGIVRVSGPLVPALIQRVIGSDLLPRHATIAFFRDEDGETLDQGIALSFPAPASFTGEDVLELQGHGSPVVLDRLMKALISLGARVARPGEFTERAFLNGKIDLVQAEAVADLIESAHEGAARAAFRTLQGVFSETLKGLHEDLAYLRSRVEVGLDFPDEVLDITHDEAIQAALHKMRGIVAEATQRGREGRLLREGAQIVIAGAPNAGKSTLLNALAGHEAAIVSPYPGTTRDPIRERVAMDGLTFDLVDTAGLRTTEDPVEGEGVRRAEALLERADCILWLIDDTAPPATFSIRPSCPVIPVYTKTDQSGRATGLCDEGVAVCALSGAGLADLRGRLRATLLGGVGATAEGGAFTARRRHVVALERVDAALEQAQFRQQEGHVELVAEELRRAHDSLGQITGQVSNEELLARIFADFCIGK